MRRLHFGLLALVGCAPATPASDCIAASARDSLIAVLSRAHARNPVPGISGAMYAPSRWPAPVAAAVGFADREARRPMTTSDRLLAGSVGKTMWAAMALRLAARGAVDLDAPIDSFLRVPRASRITPRMLLLHTTGYPEYDAPFMEALIRDPLRARGPDDWFGVLERATLSDTGKVRYSDLNYVVLAAVLDQVIRADSYQWIADTLFRAAGLTASTGARAAQIDGLAVGYDGPRGLFGQARLMHDGRLVYNPQFEWGGGGWVSTPSDLARWFAGWRLGVLFPDSLWPAITARPSGLPDSVTTWKGLGVDVVTRGNRVDVYHTGYIPGYLSFVRWFEPEGVAIAVQVNSSDDAQLPQDPMEWLDELAAAFRASCTAPSRGG
ncbi:MAG: beta-lactamase family protein [Gemmatimonadetes bacterium]|nr:beta-lactamase family protein [Gemmatimonadota bacterium]